jgi:outer membrane protein OmpA-like peptidoglycan-associated protein
MNKKILLILLLFGNHLHFFSQEIEILVHPEKILISEIKQLNTDQRECNISIMPDGKTLFYMSTRALKNGGMMGNGDIYQSNFRNAIWQTPTALGENINTFSGEDEPSVDAEGKSIYYQSWDGDWRMKNGPYFNAKLGSKGWGKGVGLGGGITQFFAKESSANMGYGTDGMAVSSDGNLFIVACGPEYEGAMDIYYSIKKNGIWSYPKIMGVSTDGDERSVFIAGDNKTIYFSSDGHGGFGGLDIFKVVIEENGKLGEIINIGAPFNTAADDQGFVASVDGKSAFFIRNLDIFFADISELTEKIKPVNPTIDTSSVVIKKETIITKKEIEEENIRAAEQTVYFDFNEYQLQETEKQKIIASLSPFENLQQVTVKLTGHCDNIGPSTYNDNLSNARITSVVAFLTKLGVNPLNIKSTAHGENIPAKSNESELGRKLNRRVELDFSIL